LFSLALPLFAINSGGSDSSNHGAPLCASTDCLNDVCVFHKQVKNTNKCPSGFFHVKTEADCRKAATLKHGASFAAVGNWNSNHNRHCFTEGNGKSVYWNKGGTDSSDHGGPLCASVGCGMGGCASIGVCTFASQKFYTSNYNCIAGHYHVNTEKACKALVAKKSGARFAAVGNWNSQHNQACFTEGGGKNVYWNRYALVHTIDFLPQTPLSLS
jgi:hypothetical protein